MANIITLGYYSYSFDEETAAVLITAALAGKIRTAEKKYQGDNTHKVVIGKPIDIQAENLEEITANEASVAELKQKIKELEGKLNG